MKALKLSFSVSSYSTRTLISLHLNGSEPRKVTTETQGQLQKSWIHLLPNKCTQVSVKRVTVGVIIPRNKTIKFILTYNRDQDFFFQSFICNIYFFTQCCFFACFLFSISKKKHFSNKLKKECA